MFITPEKNSKTSKIDSKVIWYSSWRRIFQHFNRHNSRPPNVSLEYFFEHFRNLTSDSSSTYISIANYLDTDSPIFESLDTKIRPLEIDACIRKLKKHKCAGKDNLIKVFRFQRKTLLLFFGFFFFLLFFFSYSISPKRQNGFSWNFQGRCILV